ncbi:uncharacterized protein RHIMIDRAFT_289321 [Rhizopus microsporus ATCC 52813]|uniref:Uncharacterized protein n=1 Tax=Rhizopus microsporus ATCC 52813 TaxID=1340429 RepID=A0A2G4T698_RHIZD|nr:uncharacterized protein RHIMIDRAFT_289321 [Rhizopus microsporus ATCC 52813]PHZ16545.1 hypothetical protein RHIMIDRAFT_289321 [Rhizopus microsporus ATCC 52813]
MSVISRPCSTTDTSFTDKNLEIKYQDSTTAEPQGTEIMLIDSEPYCENNCYDTGDWRSTPSCELSTERPSRSPQVTQQQLEYTMPDKPEKFAGVGVVVKRGPIEKWSSNPTQTINTGSNHLRRRFRLRLGISSASVQTAGFWSTEEKEDSINVRGLLNENMGEGLNFQRGDTSPKAELESGLTTTLRFFH